MEKLMSKITRSAAAGQLKASIERENFSKTTNNPPKPTGQRGTSPKVFEVVADGLTLNSEQR